MPTVTFGCLLLLVHHELDHVVLVHEFLALRQGSFGLMLIGVRPGKFGLRRLLAALAADLALEIVEVAMVGLDSTLASEGLGGRRFVGKLGLIFSKWLPYLVPGGGILPVSDLRRVL